MATKDTQWWAGQSVLVHAAGGAWNVTLVMGVRHNNPDGTPGPLTFDNLAPGSWVTLRTFPLEAEARQFAARVAHVLEFVLRSAAGAARRGELGPKRFAARG